MQNLIEAVAAKPAELARRRSRPLGVLEDSEPGLTVGGKPLKDDLAAVDHFASQPGHGRA